MLTAMTSIAFLRQPLQECFHVAPSTSLPRRTNPVRLPWPRRCQRHDLTCQGSAPATGGASEDGMRGRLPMDSATKDSGFFDKEMAAARTADPMNLWPGPSSPAEFEFGCSTLEGYRTDDDEPGLSATEMESGDRQDSVEDLIDELSDPRKDMFEDLSWDTYLGDVTIPEQDEEPPQYVPPPPISAEDMDMQDKVESLMYALKEILPGPLDLGKVDTIRSLLSASVEVENPVVCLHGPDRFVEWLQVLAKAEVSVVLHEIYYENLPEHPDKRWVYAIWTMKFPENANTCADELGVEDPSGGSGPIHLSGETVFEMQKSGLVSRASSTWYVLREGGEASFAKAKKWLWRLAQRTFS